MRPQFQTAANPRPPANHPANISDAIQIATFLGGMETGPFTMEELESRLDMSSSELAQFVRTGQREGWLNKTDSRFIITPKGREHGLQLCRELRV